MVPILHLIINDPLNQRINKTIMWIKQNFTQRIRIDNLAALIHMSPSAFRSNFRTITGTSPLQFQKQLRLQEARQLIFLEKMAVSCAAFTVGYESTSQFSREYKRLFGVSPQRDTYCKQPQ